MEIKESGAPAAVEETGGQGTQAQEQPTGGAEPTGGTPAQQTEPTGGAPAKSSASEPPADDGGARARADAERSIMAALGRAGIKNPKTGKPVATMADIQAIAAARNQQTRSDAMRRLGMDEKQFGDFVADLDEVQEAKALKEEMLEQKSKERLNSEIREISKLDPSIKSSDDLLRHESIGKIQELVRAGCSISDAFRVANWERLMDGARKAGAQDERNRAAGKGHLQPTPARGDGGTAVPEATLKVYRKLYPGLSDADLRAKYNKTLK